jgi:hypothetical protein
MKNLFIILLLILFFEIKPSFFNDVDKDKAITTTQNCEEPEVININLFIFI